MSGVVNTVGRVFNPLINATKRVFTAPGTGAEPQTSTAPTFDMPPPSAPPVSPSPKPKGKTTGQQSFLSGAASAQFNSGSGGGTGKTLIGS